MWLYVSALGGSMIARHWFYYSARVALIRRVLQTAQTR